MVDFSRARTRALIGSRPGVLGLGGRPFLRPAGPPDRVRPRASVTHPVPGAPVPSKGRTMPSTRSAIAALASVATVVTGGAMLSPADANPSGTGLVISEVYGAGGNAGALENADYVELFNPTSAAISVVGDYIHYRAGTGGS